MAETIKFLNLEGLQQYDGLIKTYIDEADAASIKGVGLSADSKKLLFYKEEPISGATPAYEVTLPETDLSKVMKLVESATAQDIAILDVNGQVVDSGKKLSDLATAAQGAKADSAVQTVETGTTNGTIKVDGTEVSVAGLKTAAYQNADAFDVAGAAEAVKGNSSDVAGTATVYGALASAADAKAAAVAAQTDVDKLEATVGTVTDGKTVVQMIAEAQAAATYDDTAIKGLISNNTQAIEAETARAKGVEGALDDLETSAKTNLVSAINEVRDAVSAGGTAAVITIDTATTTDGYLKSYTIKQGENTVGIIDIPKDMVVQSGSVVTDPEGQAAGTYIKLVLANVEEPLYINVGTLVDIYTAKASATQVQVTIDSATREISAAIVAESITSTELASDAVTTAKIADANVTKAKLSTELQASIAKADSAVQAITIGGANGTVAVDGVDVAVKGLGSAAFTESSAYDVAGAASAVLGTESDDSAKNTVYGAKAAAADAKSAAIAANTAAEAAQDNVDALEEYVGTFTAVGDETTLVGYIDAKAQQAQTSATYDDTALKNRVSAVEEDIAEINNAATGILKQAKDYADGKDADTLASAKAYTDVLEQGQVTTNKNNIATNTANIAQNTSDIATLRADVDAITAIPTEDIQALFA